jgi:hypothetical protein
VANCWRADWRSGTSGTAAGAQPASASPIHPRRADHPPRQSHDAFDRLPSRAASGGDSDCGDRRRQSPRAPAWILAAPDNRPRAQAGLSRHVRVQ